MSAQLLYHRQSMDSGRPWSGDRVRVAVDDLHFDGAAQRSDSSRRGYTVFMRDPAPLAVTGRSAGQTPSAQEKARAQLRLDLPHVSTELLQIVAYLTATDGPLTATEGSWSWHERLLLKAKERLEIVDGFLRGRVAFFAAGKDRGYEFFDSDVKVASAALDTGRAAMRVVDTVLAGHLPSESDIETMGDATLRIYALLDAL